MSEGQGQDDHADRLKALEARIDAARAKQAPKPRSESHYSQANMAWRMVVELVAGLAIGFGMGYGLDWVFGTIPLFLLVFTLLGLAAGVKTMMRTAKEVQTGTDGDAVAADEGMQSGDRS